MPAPKKKNINLLKRENFEYSKVGKVLKWLLSAGRVIVIFTELIVISAFLSRFWLDKKLNNLFEENNAKKSQIEASAGFETEFRNFQTRLAVAKNLDEGKTQTAKIVKDLASLLPPGVLLTNITFSGNELSIQGTALSEGGLAGFVKALQGTSERFKNPFLTSISLETVGQQLINFSIKVPVEKKKG